MNIAMVLQHRLVMGLQFLMAGAANPNTSAKTSPKTSPKTSRTAGQQPHVLRQKNVPISATALRVSPSHSPSAPSSSSSCYKRALTPFGTNTQTQQQHKAMPLRVLRAVEGQAACNTDQLRISGRMANVSAELDRLAAREVAMH